LEGHGSTLAEALCLALRWTSWKAITVDHGHRGITVSRKRTASSACRRSRCIRMVSSDPDYGYPGPCRLLCWVAERSDGCSCQSAQIRRTTVCGTAGLQRLAALPETVARRSVSRLNPDTSPESNPICATSAGDLHSFLLAQAAGPGSEQTRGSSEIVTLSASTASSIVALSG
jgi:hypothetical protein